MKYREQRNVNITGHEAKHMNLRSLDSMLPKKVFRGLSINVAKEGNIGSKSTKIHNFKITVKF